MSRTVTSAVADLRSTLIEVREAWAAWRDTASNARFSAVMGPSLSRHLRFSDEYSAADSVHSDVALRREIDKASRAAPGLMSAVEKHIEWVVETARESIREDLTLLDPNFTLNLALIEESAAKAEAEHSRVVRQFR